MSDTATERRTQDERRATAEQRLLTAAAELIAESGPAALTLAGVGERAGYSRGLATHYFGTKAALVQRVADAVTEQFRTALLASQADDATALDRLLALVDTYIDVVIAPRPENRARLVLIADAVADANADGRDVVVEASTEFRAAIVDGLHRGGLPGTVDADGFATLVAGLLRGVAFESMLDPSIDLRAVRTEIVALFTARFATATS